MSEYIPKSQSLGENVNPELDLSIMQQKQI